MPWLDSILRSLFPADHAFGCLSLLPPVTAIVLAITTRRVVVSLLAGIFVGALLAAQGDPFLAVASGLETHLWASLRDEDHLRVFAFTLMMGAMVGVMQQGGGMQALVDRLAPVAKSRSGGQLTVWVLGLLVFFDDYANSLLLGHTMRPLTDRLRISREKLAYLVDSTAAPVAGLAIVSTWVAGEIGFIQAGFADLGLDRQPDGFAVFIETIPYRFYVLLALAFVPLVAILGRDFGEMLRAERAAVAGDDAPAAAAVASAGPRADWRDAFWPVIAVIGVTVALILFTGARNLATDPLSPAPTWFTTFGNGDSYLSLVYGSLAGLLTACLLAVGKGTLGWNESRAAAFEGARHVLVALTILWLAWALSGLTGSAHLGTGDYLGGLLQNALDVRWMPTAVFVLASFVAFATGTSWGTMGILMPLVVAVTYRMLAETNTATSPHDPLLVATIGSVLAGAIFGDHCSPISDTTVLSSQASGCHHIAHVRTQLPYALAVAGVSILCGTLPAGFGVSPWILLPLGVIALVVLLYVVGQRVSTSPGTEARRP